jgi:transcriptional regulator with XRE-family HTH domain
MRQRSWTVARTAEAAGISTSTMYKVLRGEIVSPRTLGKVRKELNIVMAVKTASVKDASGLAASRRKLAGQIVEDEYARQCLTREQAADRMCMSPSTLDRVRDGGDRLTGPTLRSVEGALGLPDDLLSFIINGDMRSIDTIGDDEMRPGLRRVIVAGLERITAQARLDE